MGFTPAQVNEMSMWQFMAAIEGYAKVNNPEDDSISDQEVDEIWEWMKSKE